MTLSAGAAEAWTQFGFARAQVAQAEHGVHDLGGVVPSRGAPPRTRDGREEAEAARHARGDSGTVEITPPSRNRPDNDKRRFRRTKILNVFSVARGTNMTFL